ncbi:MAG: HEAT repeat domain-containing protein [Planctomycetes bacterium]|nr:HEAT repeat domain-containing protein [Planctomycetota bacterium]
MKHLSLLPAVGLLAASVAAQDDGDVLAGPRTHYERVERELRARSVAHLDAATRAARAAVLDELHAYRIAERFGVNLDFPGMNMPYFVDAGGRRCAVAWLLDRTGRPELTLDVATAANHVWVAELEGDPRLAAWLAAHGLTLWEAARIQAPSIGGGGSWRGEPGRSGGPAQPPTVPRTLPEDVTIPSLEMPTPWSAVEPVPAGPRGGTSGAGAGGGAAGGRPVPAAPRPAAGPTTPAGGVPLGELLAAETWQEWWRFNRAFHLDETNARVRRLRGLDPVAGPVTGGDDSISLAPAPFGPAERDAARELLRAALQHDDAAVRAAAVVALGRIATAADLEPMLALLDDPNRGVRNEAILALGAAGRHARAVLALSRLALDGSLAGDGAPQVSAFVRPVAIVALGLARRVGAPAVHDGLVRALVDRTGGEEGERIATAALLYAELSGAAGFEDLRAGLLRDQDRGIALRSRAVLDVDFADRAARRPVLEALAGRELTLRRSAAFALGRSHEDLALPSLMTGFELEKELFTRATMLLAIGMHDGKPARDFLLEQLGDGRKPLRAWAALALGIWNRETGDPLVAERVRAAWADEKNRDQADAYLLAMGLGRDAAALDLLLDVVAHGGSSLSRATAAEALALIGRPEVAEALRTQLGSDSCPYARAVAAEVLGYLGDPADAGRIVAGLRAATTPLERARVATALGRLGGRAAWRALRGELDRDDLTARERGALLAALGLVLDEDPSRRLAELGRAADFTVFPDWLLAIVSSTL